MHTADSARTKFTKLGDKRKRDNDDYSISQNHHQVSDKNPKRQRILKKKIKAKFTPNAKYLSPVMVIQP